MPQKTLATYHSLFQWYSMEIVRSARGFLPSFPIHILMASGDKEPKLHHYDSLFTVLLGTYASNSPTSKMAAPAWKYLEWSNIS